MGNKRSPCSATTPISKRNSCKVSRLKSISAPRAACSFTRFHSNLPRTQKESELLRVLKNCSQKYSQEEETEGIVRGQPIKHARLEALLRWQDVLDGALQLCGLKCLLHGGPAISQLVTNHDTPASPCWNAKMSFECVEQAQSVFSEGTSLLALLASRKCL